MGEVTRHYITVVHVVCHSVDLFRSVLRLRQYGTDRNRSSHSVVD